MCAYSEYPISTGELVKVKSKEEFRKYLTCYACIFDCEFENIESKILFEHYLSVSKCNLQGEVIEDNGRLVYADKCETTITNIDFEVIERCYKWSSFKIKNFRIYKKGYLPKDLILTILELYAKKTTLKGVKGMEREYLNAKENVNSVYGMACTSIVRNEFNYDNIDGWSQSIPDIREKLNQYNTSFNRFLFYGFGLFVTALARRNIWTAIYTTGKSNKYSKDCDYIYSDTDSCKITHHERYKEYFETYNQMCVDNLKRMCKHYNIDFELCHPKTIEGKEKMLGVFDYEGTAQKFKTLGAKRYMTYKDGELSYTIAGCGKKKGVPYLLNKFNGDIDKIFDYFDEDFTIPSDYTMKQTHTYIDEEYSAIVTDYEGVKCKVHELSYIHLEPCEFTLSLSKTFKEFLATFRKDLY